MEIIAIVLLIPWSIVNGEMQLLISSSPNWFLMIGTAGFGGIRIISQFYFLNETSATRLATSNIVIQVLLTFAGTVFFHDPITLCLILGSIVTIVMSSSYVYLKAIGSTSYSYSLPSLEERNKLNNTASNSASSFGTR